ncbi:uncharacterized protein MYCFIDRAFT_111364, partial [Pseudocercospora fijiensis CIRAD86]
SKRQWIRWESDHHPPSQPHEPTNTLVLTSPGSRFVDIRILNSGHSDPEIPQLARDAAILPSSHLDWAFAGTSTSEILPTGGTKSTWTHFVDSRHPDVSKVSDSALMFPQPNGQGLTLESGSMLNVSTNQIEKYEEMWLEIPPRTTNKSNKTAENVEVVVLELWDDEAGTRGMVVRVGSFCQGVVRRGEGFSVERWEWEEKGGWRRVVRMGDLWMPCGVAMERGELVVGGKVRFGEDVWGIVE